MARRTGWTDRLRLIDSGGSDVTANLGVIVGGDFDFNKGGLEARGGVNTNGKTAYVKRGLSQYNGSITLHTDNLYLLRAIGQVSGTDLVHVNGLPEWEFKAQASDDEHVHYTGFKFGQIEVEIEVEEVLTITGSGQGLTTSGDPLTAGLLSTEDYANEPDVYDEIPVKIDGTLVGGLQLVRFSISRQLQRRGDVGSGSKDPTYLAEGFAELDISELTIDVEDEDVYQRAHDDSSHTVTMEIPNGEILQFDEVIFNDADPQEQNGEDPIRTATTSGVGTSWQVTNIGGT